MSMQRYDGVVQDSSGSAISGATVTVRVKSSGALASTYSDEVLTAKTNPLTTTTDGSFWFYAADDDYTIAATYGGATYTLGDVTLHSPEAWRQLVAKTASVPVNNSNVLKDDEELVFNVLDGETWEFDYVLVVTTAAAADFKYGLNTTPGGAGTGRTGHHAYTDATTLADAAVGAFGGLNVILHAGAVATAPLFIHGYFTANANCTVDFTWAQNTADVSDTEVHIGSYLIARKVSLA